MCAAAHTRPSFLLGKQKIKAAGRGLNSCKLARKGERQE